MMKGLLLQGIYEMKRLKNLLVVFCCIAFELLMVVLSSLNPDTSDDVLSRWIVAGMMDCCLIFFSFANLLMENEKSRWNVYCVNTPVGRKGYASAQYGVSVIFGSVGALVSLLYPLLITIICGHADALELLIGFVSLFCFSMLIASLMLPCLLRFGSNQFAAMLVLFVPVLIIGSLVSFIPEAELMKWVTWLSVTYNKLLMVLVELSVTAVIVFLSRLISVRLLMHRAF